MKNFTEKLDYLFKDKEFVYLYNYPFTRMFFKELVGNELGNNDCIINKTFFDKLKQFIFFQINKDISKLGISEHYMYANITHDVRHYPVLFAFDYDEILPPSDPESKFYRTTLQIFIPELPTFYTQICKTKSIIKSYDNKLITNFEKMCLWHGNVDVNKEYKEDVKEMFD